MEKLLRKLFAFDFLGALGGSGGHDVREVSEEKTSTEFFVYDQRSTNLGPPVPPRAPRIRVSPPKVTSKLGFFPVWTPIFDTIKLDVVLSDLD